MSDNERPTNAEAEAAHAEQAAEPRAPAAAPSGADGRETELEPFLQGFPSTPELDRLVSAFRSGNYALVRREAPALAQSTVDPRVAQAALELRRRIDPDPLARYILFVSVGLLVMLVLVAYLHARHG